MLLQQSWSAGTTFWPTPTAGPTKLQQTLCCTRCSCLVASRGIGVFLCHFGSACPSSSSDEHEVGIRAVAKLQQLHRPVVYKYKEGQM